MKTRFDLEDNIMQCWRTGDDIKLILDNVENLNQDGIMNALIGVESLHEMRMNQLFRTFEALVANQQFTGG